MKQSQFDTLLAWTTMNTLHSSVLVEQNQRGRPLTGEERTDCLQRTREGVEVLIGLYEENRKQ